MYVHSMAWDMHYRVERRRWLLTWVDYFPPSPTEKINRLTGLGLHPVLRTQFPISTSYIAKVDLSVVSQMVFSDLE